MERVPLGPKPSPSSPATGRLRRSGLVDGARRRAACVRGPAMPTCGRRAKRWKRRTAAFRRGPKAPSNGPEGKPCQASLNWSSATSQPRAPMASERAPSSGLPSRPSAWRVRGPTMPSGSSPCRCWNASSASSVSGPRQPSTGPAYASAARSATCNAAMSALPAAPAARTPGAGRSAQIVPTDAARKRTYHPYSARRPITLIVGCL